MDNLRHGDELSASAVSNALLAAPLRSLGTYAVWFPRGLLLRLAARQAHFMPLSLLDSQFADLEDPQPDEPHIRVDIGAPPTVVAQGIWRELGLGDIVESGAH